MKRREQKVARKVTLATSLIVDAPVLTYLRPVKKEDGGSGTPFATSRSQSTVIDDEDEIKNEANALDLSESEEEEEMEEEDISQ